MAAGKAEGKEEDCLRLLLQRGTGSGLVGHTQLLLFLFSSYGALDGLLHNRMFMGKYLIPIVCQALVYVLGIWLLTKQTAISLDFWSLHSSRGDGLWTAHK